MELLNQPFTGQLGNRLIEWLDTSGYHTLKIFVAFAKNSGVLRIKDAIERFRRRGGIVHVYVGVDLGGTSYEALTALLLNSDLLAVVHSEKGQTFHPKIYQFLGKNNDLIVVGSHNLTGGGLWTNFESSVILSQDHSRPNGTEIPNELDNYVSSLISLDSSLMQISAQADIDKLLEHGYVLKEVTQQVRLAKINKKDRNQERLFGNGAPAQRPRVSSQANENLPATPAAPTSPVIIPYRDDGDTIWFETRRMTGGSRNILDLSKRSLVTRGDPTGTPFDLGDPRFMRGGVEFFGLDPAVTGRIKDIILNFEGVDYIGNTILFPVGDRANGTWRLQIKGINSSGKKITDSFREKSNEYLVGKVLTFTKVQDDYFYISVFHDSELSNFEAASRILARNGETANAKRLGLL